jgi:metal-responsive CopG/Arc/MetJ family transcriptional regulator
VQTIAISIDTPTLKAVDRLRGVGKRKLASRSEVIRQALQRYVAEQHRLEWEARERDIIKRHHKSLNAEASAALADQAMP